MNKKLEAAKNTTNLGKNTTQETYIPIDVDDAPPPPPHYIVNDVVALGYYVAIIEHLKEYKMFIAADVYVVAQAACWQSQFDKIMAIINGEEAMAMPVKNYSEYLKMLATASTRSMHAFTKLGLSPLAREQMRTFVGKQRESGDDGDDPIDGALGSGTLSLF